MKTQKIIADINGNILLHIFGMDNSFLEINVDSLSGTTGSTIINSFISLCDELRQNNEPVIPIPSYTNEPIYTMTKPCPADSGLTCNIYDTSYSNDKDNKVIKIDVLAIHYDSDGHRVPKLDTYSYVLADMSDENRVEVTPGVFEYSYTLADTMLANGTGLPDLIQMAIHIGDVDGTLNKRLYNL
jgi:hypothetical protein